MKNIKNWYESTYPDDELGQEINPDATFEELLINIPNIYDYLNVGDSVVRERVFEQLAEILGVEYEIVYQHWMDLTVKSLLPLLSTEELKEELNRRGGYFISWCEDDIQIVIDDQFEDDERLIDNPLNDDDIRIILEKIFDDHDANIGINWDVLYYGIDSYLDERKKSQNTQP